MTAVATLGTPVRVPYKAFAGLASYAVLYGVMYGWMRIYLFIYQTQIAEILKSDRWMKYDGSRALDYELVCLLTPLAFLPAGPRLRSAAQYLLGPLMIMVFLPVPIIFLGQVRAEEYWHVFLILWTGYFIIGLSSRYALRFSVQAMNETRFHWVSYGLLTAFSLALVLASRGNLSFVSLNEASNTRSNIDTGGPIVSYAVYIFTGSFGGFLVAYGARYRKILPIVVGTLGFLVCFGIFHIKLAALAPVWVLAAYLAGQYIVRGSFGRYLFVLMVPYLGVAAWVAIAGYEKFSPQFWAWGLVSYRLYYIPPLAFSIYYDFFQLHPYTYWSHINLVGLVVPYPYAQDLYSLLNSYYRMGTYTAAFFIVDGIAAGGVDAIPIACMMFAVLLIVFNGFTRGLEPQFLAIVLAMPAVCLIDSGPLSTILMSQGVGLLGLLLLFVPRLRSGLASRAPPAIVATKD